MSLVQDTSRLDSSRDVGIVCDCYQAEFRDDVVIHEVVHFRCRAGYGSAWGDGNAVELDLFKICRHRMFAAFARVMPSTGGLSGHVAHGFDPRRVKAGLFGLRDIVIDPVADGLASSHRASGAWAWIGHHALRYVIPAQVLLSPMLNALRGFFQAIEREVQSLRPRFGRH